MADGEEDSSCERWEVENQEKDRDAAAIIDCHFFNWSEID